VRKLYNEFFHVPKHGRIREKVMLVRAIVTAVIILACSAAMSLTVYAYFSYNVTSGSNMIKTASFDADITVTAYLDNTDTPDDMGKTNDPDGADDVNPPETPNGSDDAGDADTPNAADDAAKTDASDDTNKTDDIEVISVQPTSTENKTAVFELEPGNYTVTLTKGDSTAETGFCIIHVGETKYYTQQIGVDVNAVSGERESVSFMLSVEEQATVAIESHWGTSSHYGYNNSAYYIVDSAGGPKTITVGTATAPVDDAGEIEGNTSGETGLPPTDAQQGQQGTEDPAQPTPTPAPQPTPTTTTADTSIPNTEGTGEPTTTPQPTTSESPAPTDQNTSDTTETTPAEGDQPAVGNTGTPTTETGA